MSETYLLAFIQLLLPLTLLVWVGLQPLPSWIGVALQVFAVGAFLLALQLAGLWVLPPWWTPWLYWLVLLLIAVGRLMRRPSTLAPKSGMGWALAMLAAMFGGYNAWIATQAWLGRLEPANAVELEFPLRGGTYLVANGGTNTLVSSHARTLARATPMQREYYGQSYGVDLIRIGEAGLQSRQLGASDPASYYIFGNDVLAPCEGIVVIAEDGWSDMTVPAMDTMHMAGNHVVLRCGNVDVLLAHFRKGSVRAVRGQHVRTGQIIAAAGNSGNSSVPHLHVHAQRPGTADAPLSGDPLPIRLGGRYLVRGDRVRANPLP